MTADEILQEWQRKGYFDNNRPAFHMAGALVELLDWAQALYPIDAHLAGNVYDIITERLRMAHDR